MTNNTTGALRRQPRVYAALTALAMMLATAMPSLMPKVALADGAYDPTITDTGSIKLPSEIHLGGIDSTAEPDPGVATWVGGNMYVGHKVDNIFTANGPMGSYAVEAEGLTVVNGKVMMKPMKESWGGKGFRWGVVGFGSQFRPTSGSDVLLVGNNTVDIPNGMKSAVQAWNKGGWIGSNANECDKNTKKCAYNMKVNGNSTNIWDTGSPSLFVQHGDGSLSWNSGPGVLGTWTDYMNETTGKGGQMSAMAAELDDTGTVAFVYPNTSEYGPYRLSSFERQKYNWNKDVSEVGMSYKFEFDANNTVNKEAIIVFEGSGDPSQEVFTVDAAKLNALQASGYTGVSYAFKRIADTANIVINVDTTNTIGKVDFHNGWRFYAEVDGQLKDIADGYVEHGNDTHATKYSSFAQRIIWNYPGADDIVIRGGYATGTMKSKGTSKHEDGKPDAWGTGGTAENPISTYNLKAEDDPAAAMLGSIIAPNARFESHISTNGRVWVGGDFEMYNDAVVKHSNGQEFINLEHSKTTSIIDMDQERHNFPANIMSSSDAAMIGWQKVSKTNNQALGGTTWKVYATKEDAQSGSNPIYTVTDNGNNDWDKRDGFFQIHNLNPNSNYYLRETNPGDGYATNPNIYLIQAKTGGETVYSDIVKVFDENLSDITNDSDTNLLNGNQIQNESETSSTVAWGKYAEGDTHHTPLAGSKWELTIPDGAKVDIEDLVAKIDHVELYNYGTRVDATYTQSNPMELHEGSETQLTATVVGKDGAIVPQNVKWTTSNSSVVNVHSDGKLVVLSQSNDPVQITATSKSDTTKSASVWIKPTAAELTNLTIQTGGLAVPEYTLTGAGSTVNLAAVATPGGTYNIIWSSSNSSVATVTGNGMTATVTAVKNGTASVQASFGGQVATVEITVTGVASTVTTIYIRWENASEVKIHHWGEGLTDNGWPGTSMKRASCAGNDWYKYDVPKANGGFNAQFSINDGSNRYMFGADDKIAVPNGNSVYTVNGGAINPGAPSGCSTSGYSARGMYSMKRLNGAAPNTVTSGAAPSNNAKTAGYEDINPKAGIFELQNLPDGTYSIKESVAPEGYTLNPNSYVFEVESGNVTWTTGNPQDGVYWISDKPTEVNWQKVNAADASEHLRGSKWDVYGDDTFNKDQKLATIADCATNGCTAADGDPEWAVDLNRTAGYFQIKHIPVGKYYLKEAQAPTGYVASTQTYKFEVTKEEGVVNISNVLDAGNNQNEIGNTRKTGSVAWTKVSSANNEQKLAGSEWTLTYKKGTEDQVVLNIKDCNGKTGCEALPADGAAWNVTGGNVTYNFNGTFSIKNLPWGSYELVETKAPDGYNLDQTPITFEINATNVETVQVDRKIENTPGAILPSAGGDGQAMWVMLAGALVLLMGMGCAVIVNRRRV